jgi:hypothetical protein
MNRKSRSTAGHASSRMLALAAIVVAGLVPGAAPAQSPEVQRLEVTPEKGSAPLGVILTGPTSFVAQAHDFIFTHGACSAAVGGGVQVFTIDWGDDPEKTSAWPRAASPECRLTHDYTAPGTYRIRVGFLKPAASDSSEPEWLGEATIIVTGP